MLMTLCTDERFMDDTLFLVFEEDYRFTPTWDDPSWKLHNRRERFCKHQLWEAVPPTPGVSNTSGSPPHQVAPPREGHSPRSWLGVQHLQPKCPEWGDQGCPFFPNRTWADDWQIGEKGAFRSCFLMDLVAYANLAARLDRHFVFAGWQPGGAGSNVSNPNRFGSGCMLTMFSKREACRLRHFFASDPHLSTPGHIDMCLKKFYCQEQHSSRATYLNPPLGGYTEHISGCEKTFFRTPRPSIWGEAWCSIGTRPDHCWRADKPERWFMSFGRKGGAIWEKAVDVSRLDIDPTWTTHWAVPDDRPESDKKLTDRAKRLKRQMVCLNEKWRTWVRRADEVSGDNKLGCVNMQPPKPPHSVRFATTRTPREYTL
jgi:hypothetical protein